MSAVAEDIKRLCFFKAGCCWCLNNPLLLSVRDPECILRSFALFIYYHLHSTYTDQFMITEATAFVFNSFCSIF